MAEIMNTSGSIILSRTVVTPWPTATSLSLHPDSNNTKFFGHCSLPKPSTMPPPHFSTPTSGSGCSLIEKTSSSLKNMATSCGRHSQSCSALPTATASATAIQDLYEFICSGPLVAKMGLTPEKVADSIDKWLQYGSQLCRLFQLNELFLNEAQKIGFSAPQGCGKTTLVFALDYLFRRSGRRCATISIDDFYLTAEDQAKLRDANPENKLLEFRGNAGSHDLSLSVETLTTFSKLTKEGEKMKVPRYDKSAFKGRGDRADPSMWPEIEGPLTVVLFEGWMLGFKPIPDEVAEAVDPQLKTVNKNLQAYYDAWHKFIKAWVVIKIKDPSCVYEWRLQAEKAMRADGKPGMSDDEVLDFVSRYLPAYKAYLPQLYSEGPSGSDPNHLLVVEIDEGRNPILGS